MLKELRISNFAIIEKQTIFFGKGLNVISGQTGSGKSIILNALELILGARPRAQFIRTGAEQLEVEGLFDIRDLPIEIRESLPDEIATEELLLTRSININGKSKVSINGKPASVSLLQEISQKIINICGQGQHISLLDSKFHLRLVDEYAGNTQILKEYKIKHAYFKELSKAAQEFDNKREVLLREYSELQNLVEELDKVRLSPGIRTELEAQVRKLESAEKIILGMQQIMPGFSAEEGVTAQIAKISAALNSLVRFDPAIKDFIQQL